MPFDGSLPDEVAPGEATALRCKYFNGAVESRCKLVYDHSGIHKYDLTTREPQGFASSSPDEPTGACRRCGHHKMWHALPRGGRPARCDACADDGRSQCHAFVPAEPERIDLDCIRPTGCRDKLKRGCAHGCAEAADDLTRLGQEMEAEAPRRPPYAVAYELEDGTHFEVALPGDATVGTFNGALIITHTQSPVKGLTQARPMEG